MKKVISTIVVIFVLVVASGLIVIYSGTCDIAASSQDASLAQWVLSTTRRNAVKRQSQTITVPAKIRQPGPELLRKGFIHYDEMCLGCHAAPGVEAGEVRAGLNPRPPRLTTVAKNRTLEELFWVIKNGIKMTGMPAWGATHNDDEIWAIVAFVNKLPELSAEEYQSMQQQGGNAGHHHEGHSH